MKMITGNKESKRKVQTTMVMEPELIDRINFARMKIEAETGEEISFGAMVRRLLKVALEIA